MVGSTATPPLSTRTKCSATAAVAVAKTGDFELHHWRSFSLRRRAIISISPAISIPNTNGGHNYHPEVSNSSLSASTSPSMPSSYTSLCEIIGSPFSIPSPCSTSAAGTRVRNRLVIRAAHAYLHLTPSGAESSHHHHHHRKGGATAIRRCFSSCFRFLCQFFDSLR